MRLKRTYILLLVVVAAVSIFIMMAYHFREGVIVTTTSNKPTQMSKDATLKYNNQTIKKIEFDYEDTLDGSEYYINDGIVIKGVLIPRPGEFDLNKDDTTDNKLYATQSGIQFIMKNIPPEQIKNARKIKAEMIENEKKPNAKKNVKSSST
jgi:hypothetical protein